jgi:hypothetical protein
MRVANFSSVSSAVIPTKEIFFSSISRDIDILVPNRLPSHLLSKKEKLKYWLQKYNFSSRFYGYETWGLTFDLGEKSKLSIF